MTPRSKPRSALAPPHKTLPLLRSASHCPCLTQPRRCLALLCTTIASPCSAQPLPRSASSRFASPLHHRALPCSALPTHHVARRCHCLLRPLWESWDGHGPYAMTVPFCRYVAVPDNANTVLVPAVPPLHRATPPLCRAFPSLRASVPCHGIPVPRGSPLYNASALRYHAFTLLDWTVLSKAHANHSRDALRITDATRSLCSSRRRPCPSRRTPSSKSARTMRSATVRYREARRSPATPARAVPSRPSGA